MSRCLARFILFRRKARCAILTWLFRFLICALVIVVVVYVCNLLVGMIVLPEPARILILLIVAVACLIAVVRYLGMPPGSGPAP